MTDINDRLSTLNAPYATEMARGAVAAVATLAVPVAATQVIEPSIVDQPIPLAVGPNPFQSWTAFDVGSATVEVRITDAAGRSVDRLTVRGRLLWRGRDASGGELPAGVYFYTVQAGKQQASGRLVRVR